MTIDELKALDVKDLKVMAYDQLALAEQTQANLRIINQVIAEKSKKEEPVKE
jgi:hypothetical protein